ncbi:DUF1471 domain-containing protein [Jinshanibacter sp. LJY008]|uniref:DUF1471 domain-containing protein n=1 Tax=Limnobaculum eriocheiris TaxID=2897391 RepID=A0A9X1MSE8_9GAMM|nr:DUF1471 domain-containing protein [Limnobaculum eriocheiris]MCD1124696.1 DUF1471 domain-containing protein [Limnobaculum eriocheiris]
MLMLLQEVGSQHASYYRVIAANSNDDSNNWRIAAEIYR